MFAEGPLISMRLSRDQFDYLAQQCDWLRAMLHDDSLKTEVIS